MTDCACMIEVDVYEHVDFYTVTTPKARKAHKCYECGRRIEVGEKYEYVSGKWDDCLGTCKTCSDCLSARNAFFCGAYYHGDIWTDINQMISDSGGQISSVCIAQLTPVARDRVCDRIQEIWDDKDWEG